jgi:hypothetical protein
MRLKALRKSILSSARLESLCFLNTSRSEWATISTPPGHPTPKFLPLNSLEMKSLPPRQKHLPTRRRIESPQHKGRTPLLTPGFTSAIDTPPATKGCRKSGASPEANKFTVRVRAGTKWKDSAGHIAAE